MKSVLDAFLQCRLDPNLSENTKGTKYAEVLEQYAEKAQILHEGLSPEKKELLEEYGELVDALSRLTAVYDFMGGFSLGMRMTYEAIQYSDRLISDIGG